MTDWRVVNKRQQELRLKEAARPYDEKLDVSATINFWMNQPQSNRATAVERVLLILQEAQQRGVIGDFAIGGRWASCFIASRLRRGTLFSTSQQAAILSCAISLKYSHRTNLETVFCKRMVGVGVPPALQAGMHRRDAYATISDMQFEEQHLVVMGEKFEFLAGDDPIAQDGWSGIREAVFRSTKARVLPLETILAQKLNAGRPRDLAHLGLVFGDFAEKVDKPKFLGVVQRFGLAEKWKQFAEFYGVSF